MRWKEGVIIDEREKRKRQIMEEGEGGRKGGGGRESLPCYLGRKFCLIFSIHVYNI